MSYVDIELTDEVKGKVLEAVKAAASNGKVRKGVNEVTKSIERKKAKLVVIAEDVNPAEIVMHIPKLCKEKGIPYAFVKTKEELGKSAGLKVGTSSIAIEDAGSSDALLSDVIKLLPKEKKEEKKE